MVKQDLEKAGILYITSDGVADFHAAGRHSFITGLLTALLWRKRGSEFAAIIVVHVEQLDGTTTCFRQTLNLTAGQNKMLVPVVLPRMKERCQCAVHKSRQVWPFVKITPVARKAEIGIVVGSAMLFGNDVLDMECDERQNVLMTFAVLALVPGTLADQSSCGGIDCHGFSFRCLRRRHGLSSAEG